tara:strand:- start:760 stop:867 length:108 start_codon:yes stop_codon:yes gene_type:complete
MLKEDVLVEFILVFVNPKESFEGKIGKTTFGIYFG